MDVASEYRTMFFIISFVKRVDVVYVFVFFLLELMYHGGEMDTK